MEIVTLNLEFEIVFTANVYNSQQRGTREPPHPRLTASALAQAGEKLGVKLTGANELRHLELPRSPTARVPLMFTPFQTRLVGALANDWSTDVDEAAESFVNTRPSSKSFGCYHEREAAHAAIYNEGIAAN
jgi:hypothetical protein